MERGPFAIECCVVLPTYNNERTLRDILQRTARLGLPMIVVNDGSTDATATLLAQWTTSPEGATTTVLHHDINRGKAQALRRGFAHALSRGFTHAATIDTDGQLDPEDLRGLLNAAGAAPDALVVGYRDERRHDYPMRSRLGRRLSNLLVRMECGLDVRDSQCGLRVYPLQLTYDVGCRTGRFCFETEVITRAAWRGMPLVQVPVACRYFDPPLRVSHFRPWLDTLRSLRMHALLLVLAIVRPHPARPAAHCSDAIGRTRLQRFFAWLNPVRTWREARASEPNGLALAAALAIGAFIANLPLYGVHAILSLCVARRLHLPPAAMVAGSLLSTPPLGPVLIVAAVAVGHALLGSEAGQFALDTTSLTTGIWPQMPLRFLAAWLLGSVVVGAACLIIVFTLAATALLSVPKASTAAGAAPSNDTTDTIACHDVTPATHA